MRRDDRPACARRRSPRRSPRPNQFVPFLYRTACAWRRNPRRSAGLCLLSSKKKLLTPHGTRSVAAVAPGAASRRHLKRSAAQRRSRRASQAGDHEGERWQGRSSQQGAAVRRLPLAGLQRAGLRPRSARRLLRMPGLRPGRMRASYAPCGRRSAHAAATHGASPCLARAVALPPGAPASSLPHVARRPCAVPCGPCSLPAPPRPGGCD